MDGKKEHKNINAKVLLLTIGVLIAITAVLLFVFMDRGRGQINMSDYINVSFGGADGAGTVSCSVDTKKLYERLAGNEKNAVIIRNIDTFVDGISASADAADKLSNGDKVTISVLYDRSLADKIGCRVAGAKFAAEVSGLGDGSVIDIFANVEVVVAGISPDAYANVLNKWQDDRLKNIAFTLDKATGIKAGDVITVTCEASAEELAEQPQAASYTADMDVSEITQRMTVDEAKAVVVQIGTCRGWTLEQVAQRRPASLKWYLYGCDQADNILKAAASVLLDNLQQKAG